MGIPDRHPTFADTVTAPAEPIHTILSSIEMSWPIAMIFSLACQALARIPIEHIIAHTVTPRLICIITSSMEPSGPIDVQWHGHWPIKSLRKFPSGIQAENSNCTTAVNCEAILESHKAV